MSNVYRQDRLIRAAEQPVTSWRGGLIRAIFAAPSTMLDKLATAQLWVGTATIERDGPYSVFPNRTRMHLPLRGNGLQLHFQEPAETISLATFDQVTFAGDRPLTVTLVDGAVEAFNLIFAPTVTAQLTVHHLTALSPAIPLPVDRDRVAANNGIVHILYAVNGAVSVATGHESVTLAAGDAYLCTGEKVLHVERAEADVNVLYVSSHSVASAG